MKEIFEFLKFYDGAFSSIQACATIVAVAIGAVWTYLSFVRRRAKYPRVEVAHHITHQRVTDHKILHGSDKTLLGVVITINNMGESLLPVRYGFIWVQQLIPWPVEFLEAISRGEDPIKEGQTQAEWPLIGERYIGGELAYREIEPGVEDHIHVEFVLDVEVTSVLVYTHIRNERKEREIGWETTSVHEIRRG